MAARCPAGPVPRTKRSNVSTIGRILWGDRLFTMRINSGLEMTNAETQAALTRFYEAFARRDGDAMAAMYAPDATFEDPVFLLTGETSERCGSAWRAARRTSRSSSPWRRQAPARASWSGRPATFSEARGPS